MQPAATTSQPADLVTLCQVELNKLSELLFGTVGELQRDAQALSIAGEEVIHAPDKPYDAPARASGFAEELLGCVRRMDALVQRLPVPPDEAQQLERIKQLQQRSQQLSEQLQRERATAEMKLNQAADMFACLSDHKLKHRA